MDTTQQCTALHIPLRKSGHPRIAPVVEIPDGAVFADVLKTLETRLQQKHLLRPRNRELLTPFWFLVETERNVFLWRCGYSLIQADEFEFWVDLEALAAKRLRQLELPDAENPFVNPFWAEQELGQSASGQDDALLEAVSHERDYLQSFLEITHLILPHLHALSTVGSMLSRELGHGDREKVLLPVLPWKKGRPEA